MSFKKQYLINRPMFDEQKLQIRKCITVIKDNVRKDGLIYEVTPLKLKVLCISDLGQIEYIEVTPDEAWSGKAILVFSKK